MPVERADSLLQSVWASLKAAADTRSPLNFLQLATLGIDRNPKLRTVVLRAVDIDRATLSFHTDIRSPKVAEMQARPAVSVLAYDPGPMLQIRMEGVASFETNEAERLRCWDALKEHSIAIYRTGRAPGTAIPDDEADDHEAGMARGGFEHFCVVQVAVASIDVVRLQSPGPDRHLFRRMDPGWMRSRLVP